jgi:N-acetyl-gamma-glutamyl-phosphate reductase
MPQTNSVLGSNSAHIQVAIDFHTNRLVISIAIDNLGKGAAGQAIQNANIISGLPEETGLVSIGIGS